MKVVQKKICLLGDFAVGKTSLVRRFVEGRFDDRYLSTIGVKISRKTIDRSGGQLKLLVWDLAGGETFTRYQPSYLRGASGALIVCDLTRRETLDCVSTYAEQLREVSPAASLVVLGNKRDLETSRVLSGAEVLELAGRLEAPGLLTSAKTGDQVEAAFTLLAEMMEGQG